jgi:hypothetical protein
MLRTALLIGLAALAPLIPALDEGTPDTAEPITIGLAPSWKVGDSYHLELTKTRQQSQGQREGKVMGTVTPVRVEVLAEHEDGYTLSWELGESTLVGNDSAAEDVMDDLANLFQGSVLQLRTDAFGTPNALLNEDEVREHIDALLQKVSELAIAEGAPPAQMKQVIDATRSMLDGPTLSTTVLKEPQVYYFACGMQLELGAVQEFDEFLPNPFGGDPFPGKTEISLESLDEASDSATLSHRLELDPEETRRIMLESFTKLAEEMGSPAPKASDLPDFSIVDEASYLLDLTTKLPRTVSHSRTVSAAGTTQIDRLTLTVVPPSEPAAVPADPAPESGE